MNQTDPETMEYPAEILSRCPECKSDQLQFEGLKYGNPWEAFENIQCNECNERFRQLYRVIETRKITEEDTEEIV